MNAIESNCPEILRLPRMAKDSSVPSRAMEIRGMELERIGDTVVGDSLDLVEAVIVREEAYKIDIKLWCLPV